MEQLTYDLAAERRRVRIGRKNKIIEVSRVRACQARPSLASLLGQWADHTHPYPAVHHGGAALPHQLVVCKHRQYVVA
jgi:hypothetical protein